MKTIFPAKLVRFACFVALLLVSSSVLANDSIYEKRRLAYIDTALARPNNDAICIQAYVDGVVDTALISNLIRSTVTNSTSDFDIVRLVRVLFLSNGSQDSLILPTLDTIPFWLTKGDTLRGYWSENHMIMWMSSHWLLHEKYGKPIDAGLETRLKHYLRLKIKYGFYEFFSSVYAPYCFSGLLNLSDFAQDPEIKDLATQASVRLLRELLMVTNNVGVMMPAAGRNYYEKYATPYGQNHNNLIYLLTGMGQRPGRASHAGAFLATSNLQIDSIVSLWSASLDTLYRIGHSLDSALILHGTQRPLDKVIFQWSSGAYFHPAVARETATLMIDSMLWRHVDFRPFKFFEGLAPSVIEGIAQGLPAMAMSSVYCGQEVAIFKQNGVTLSSIQNYWPGKAGYQQFPCVAAVGTTAVMTASGQVKPWNNRGENNANEHFPYAEQKHNVVLLMYRPEPGNIVLKSKDVALHFTDADFDEVRTDSLWLLGRQGESYVAVRRPCDGEINQIRACETVNGQAWVIVVGDSGMYGSFNNFQNIAVQSQFTEDWYYDSVASQSVYYASVTFDTVTIDHAWGVDSTISSIAEIAANEGFKLYPNPTVSEVSIEIGHSTPASIKIFDMMGRLVEEKTATNTKESIVTSHWPQGMYLVIVEQGSNRFMQRLVKQ